MFTFPFSVLVSANDTLKEIYDFSDIVKEYGLSNSSFTSQEFYDKNPYLISSYLNAIDETIDYIYSNPEKVGEQLSGYWEIDSNIIVDYIKTKPFSKEISETAYDLLVNTMYKFDMIGHKPIPFNQLPTHTILSWKQEEK